ncbi:hypothetical protein KAX22_10445 [bacterium]|nr:hypothetical protein [bacterium]
MARSFGRTFQFTIGDTTHQLSLFSEPGLYRAHFGDRQLEVHVQPISDNCILLDIDGHSVTVYLAEEGGRKFICIGGRQFVLEEVRESAGSGVAAQTQAFKTDYALVSPMPGQVVKIQVSEGDVVEKNQTLAIVEAMKMENELKASARARVKKVCAAAGDLVDAGQIIVELEPEE